MIQVKQFYFNELRECTYILSDESRECVIIDPGMSSQRERERVEQYLEENNLKLKMMLLTHGHFDHVMGCAWISEKYKAPLYISPEDKKLLPNARRTCSMFGYVIDDPPTETIDIKNGDVIKFGNSSLEVISTPGHTWGSVCFYSSADKICITGDTLFAGNCGRTDLPEGDNESMFHSLVEIISKRLPADCEIYAGHGVKSTMQDELEQNPYLREDTWI